MILFAILRHDRVRYAKNNHELKCVEFSGEFFMSWKFLTYLTYRKDTAGPKIWKIMKIWNPGNLQKSQTSPIFDEAVNGPILMIFGLSVRFICLLIRKNTFIRKSHRDHDFFFEDCFQIFKKSSKSSIFKVLMVLVAVPEPMVVDLVCAAAAAPRSQTRNALRELRTTPSSSFSSGSRCSLW